MAWMLLCFPLQRVPIVEAPHLGFDISISLSSSLLQYLTAISLIMRELFVSGKAGPERSMIIGITFV